MFRTDNEIQQDVINELKWERGLRNDDIAVGVRDGIVTLGGFVDSYWDKWNAERAVERVKGVKGIVNEIQVRLPSSAERSDADIAHAAVEALKWDVSVPHENIRVKVEKGWLTLEGEVEWHYQKEAAERAVRRLTGLKGVSNLIVVKVKPLPSDIKEKIKEALRRNAEFDADRITVEVDGNTVILNGTVRSFAAMRDAERAARNAPGVTKVENKLTIDTSLYAVA